MGAVMTPFLSALSTSSRRGNCGGGLSSSLPVAATPTAQPWFSLLTRHNLSPASVGEPFLSHPDDVARDPLPVGNGLPKRPDGVGSEIAGRSASRRKANASGSPFGSDCLSTPRRPMRSGVPGGGATGAAA